MTFRKGRVEAAETMSVKRRWTLHLVNAGTNADPEKAPTEPVCLIQIETHYGWVSLWSICCSLCPQYRWRCWRKSVCEPFLTLICNLISADHTARILNDSSFYDAVLAHVARGVPLLEPLWLILRSSLKEGVVMVASWNLRGSRMKNNHDGICVAAEWRIMSMM